MSFQVSLPIEGNRETFLISGNQPGNQKETTSLKALANRVLQRNRKETLGKLPVSIEGNFSGPVSMPGNSVPRADMDIMKAEYSRFSLWLAERDMIPRNTEAYNAVTNQIECMDRAMRKGRVEEFMTAAKHARYAFVEAEGGIK